LRHFDYLSREQEREVFFRSPLPFGRSSGKEIVSYAAGTALYSPATRRTLAEDMLHRKHEGLVSMVFDLEDAIGDGEVEAAEESLLQQLFLLDSYVKVGMLPEEDVPLLFIRVRSPEQLEKLIGMLEERVGWITGFFFPKFTPDNGRAYFQILADYNRHKPDEAPTLFGSPILESDPVIYKEQRVETLLAIREILDHYEPLVLNVRIGATDFSSLFGVRRSPALSIYDIVVVRDCIADILNVLGRVEAGYVITGPVWEYFSRHEEGLIREVTLDKENGIIGKTIIHPSHIKIVQSLYAVTHEEYQDAVSILGHHNGRQGVIKSSYSNKMNEIKPHLNWARRILAKADVYGVLHEQQSINSLLTEHKVAFV
jgi:citrate lyase beta subunit